MQNYVYDANFKGNVLTVGRTGCRKTYFTRKLAVNKFFGKLKRVERVSYIDLTEERKAEIEYYFSCNVDFHYPKSIEQFEDLLEVFEACSRTAKRNDNDDDTSSSDYEFFNETVVFGEKATRDQLIVMDDISGLADRSKKFASFLIVALIVFLSLITHVSTLFTLSIQRNQFGERFFPKLIFLIFFLLVSLQLTREKF